MIDRLDVAFNDSSELERNALRCANLLYVATIHQAGGRVGLSAAAKR
jgi:hypothetical protein